MGTDDSIGPRRRMLQKKQHINVLLLLLFTYMIDLKTVYLKQVC